MNGHEHCHCGHVADEHTTSPTGPTACEIEGCDCAHFDHDEAADEEEDGA